MANQISSLDLLFKQIKATAPRVLTREYITSHDASEEFERILAFAGLIATPDQLQDDPAYGDQVFKALVQRFAAVVVDGPLSPRVEGQPGSWVCVIGDYLLEFIPSDSYLDDTMERWVFASPAREQSWGLLIEAEQNLFREVLDDVRFLSAWREDYRYRREGVCKLWGIDDPTLLKQPGAVPAGVGVEPTVTFPVVGKAR